MIALKKSSFALLAPLGLLLLLILLAKSAWFISNPEILSIGIIFDLSFTVPLVYFLIIRKTTIPKFTVIPVFVICLAIASVIIPPSHQFYLTQVKNWILPLVELTAITLIFLKIRAIRKNYNESKTKTPDFYTAMQSAVSQLIPRPANAFVAMEIATFYYGVVYWKKRVLKPHEFSYHKESGSIALLWVVILLVMVETSVLHVLLMQWNLIAAWILSGISLYTGFQIFGMLRSLTKRPISIEENTLDLKYGILGECRINLIDISSVELSTADLAEGTMTKKLSPLGNLESHNVIVHLKKPYTIKGLYGVTKVCNAVALHVDKKHEFKVALANKIGDASI